MRSPASWVGDEHFSQDEEWIASCDSCQARADHESFQAPGEGPWAAMERL